jgi:hypothetical protein
MTSAAYDQLLVLLKHAVADNPPDEQVRRLAKGLVKALTRMLRLRQPDSHDQARIGSPRPVTGLATDYASLDLPQGDGSAQIPRQEGADPNRGIIPT